jgi:hypothetical protein
LRFIAHNFAVTFTNKECAGTHFICGFYNRKKKDIAAHYQQLCPDHTATNRNTLQKLFRILKETGSSHVCLHSVVIHDLCKTMFWEWGSEAHAVKLYTELTASIAFTQAYSILQGGVSVRTTKHFAVG